jgi:hypothetical protein
MKAMSPKPMTAEKILCYLSDDWKTRIAESPRSKGETLTFRYGIAATPNSWTLTEYRGDLAFNQVYATSFADLAPSFKTIADANPIDGMKRVISSLERITGKKIVLNNIVAGEIETAIDMGRQVDSTFEVDYAIHDKVRERIFGESETEEE